MKNLTSTGIKVNKQQAIASIKDWCKDNYPYKVKSIDHLWMFSFVVSATDNEIVVAVQWQQSSEFALEYYKSKYSSNQPRFITIGNFDKNIKVHTWCNVGYVSSEQAGEYVAVAVE
jgi:hypothetical protein